MALIDYKVVIINPRDDDNNLVDGAINCLGNIDADLSHSEIMINYGISVYGEDSIFKIFNNNAYYLPIYPTFFLTEYEDNVVFLNISDNKGGKNGLLYLPNNLSDAQIKSINRLSKDLKGFGVELNWDLEMDDGLVDGSQNYIDCDGKPIITKTNNGYQIKKGI